MEKYILVSHGKYQKLKDNAKNVGGAPNQKQSKLPSSSSSPSSRSPPPPGLPPNDPSAMEAQKINKDIVQKLMAISEEEDSESQQESQSHTQSQSHKGGSSTSWVEIWQEI